MTQDESPIGIIFDMDGVLVDSGDAHFESWRLLAVELGSPPITRKQFDRSFGRRSREIIAEWFGVNDASRAAVLDDRKEVIYRGILERGVPEMPGASQLVATLHVAGFRIAVGSSGPSKNIAMVCDALELRSFLSAIVTGEDVQRGKPDPQVFLIAAERMGTAPGRTVVIEDAPPGVEAARRAGMRCIALTSSHAAPALAAACHVVDSLGAICPDLVVQLVRSGEK